MEESDPGKVSLIVLCFSYLLLVGDIMLAHVLGGSHSSSYRMPSAFFAHYHKLCE